MLTTNVQSALTHTECVAVLELIQYCTRARGSADDLRYVFKQVERLLPCDLLAVGTGVASEAGRFDIQRLHNQGHDDFFELYRRHKLERFDPSVKRALVDNTPFLWSETRETCAGYLAGFDDFAGLFPRTDGVVVACRKRRGSKRMTVLTASIMEPMHADRHIELCGHLLPHIHEMLLGGSEDTTGYALTEREAEVLRWVTDGKTSWEISRILGVSERTVKFHLTNLFAKLDVATRSQAAAKAVRMGLVS